MCNFNGSGFHFVNSVLILGKFSHGSVEQSNIGTTKDQIKRPTGLHATNRRRRTSSTGSSSSKMCTRIHSFRRYMRACQCVPTESQCVCVCMVKG